jgi:RNA polymerase sigma factor (sigma-70 family)
VAMPALGDEAALARAAAAGDGQAFAALYDAYEGRIFTFCHRIVGSPEDAADATQDAFLKVLQRLPKLGDRELNFGAYLFTAARNASYDVIGRRKRAEPVDEIPEHGARPVTGDAGGDLFVDPERAALLGSLQESVQAANGRLPERQREVLALRELEELSYDDIAAIMDMNRNSVAQLISRARVKLRDELRGSALASVAASSADCERALPLISMRQDGQLRDASEREWLAAHLGDCATCKVSLDAMEEAGLSYRAWLPIVPLVWLRQATMAKAAELTGSDWSDVIEAGRTGRGGAGAGGSAGAAAAGAVGAAPDEALASTGSGAASGSPRRRRVLSAAAGAILLLLLFAALVTGLEDNEVQPAAAPAADTTPATTTTPKGTKRHKAPRKHATAKAPVQTATVTTPATTTTSAPSPKAPARTRLTTKTGGGNTGTTTPARPPLTGTTTTPPATTPTQTTPPPTATTPPPTTTTTPPTTTPPPSTCDPRANPNGCPPPPIP